MRNLEENARRARRLLERKYLHLDEDSIPWILNHIDCFVSQSRDNKSVKKLHLYPNAVDGDDNEFWGKIGQAIGNMQALNYLRIFRGKYFCHVRQKIEGQLHDSDPWDVEEVQAVVRAIRGPPTIKAFDSCYNFSHEASDKLYTALATLPALRSVTLSSSPGDETALASHASPTELLRLDTLRSVDFHNFSFTPALCQAAASAFTEGTAVTSLEFMYCTFCAGECAAIMANGLARNTSLISIIVRSEVGNALFDALAAALPLNAMLQELLFMELPSDDDPDAHVDWSPIFLALGIKGSGP